MLDQEKTKEERLQQLREESISRLLFRYALPSVVGSVVTALYNIVDRIFIGQGVGSDALAGLSITFPILMCMIAFGLLVGAGASVRISISMGKDDRRGASRILANSVFLTLILNLIFTILALVYMEPLLRMFGAGDTILPYAKDYLYIVLPANIFCDLSFSYNAIMRSSGYPWKAMRTMLIGAFLNLLLDPIFIFVFDWGVKGAALATVLSEIVSAAYVVSHFFYQKHMVSFSREWRDYIPNKKILWSILSIGLSPFIMMILNAGINTIMNRSFGTYASSIKEADLSIATLGVILGITQLFIQFMLGISMGMQPIVGYNYGAKNYPRVIKTFRLALAINVSSAILGFCIAILTPEVFIRLFSKDVVLAQMLEEMLQIVMFAFPMIGLHLTTVQFFQSIGKPIKSMALTLSRQLIGLIPCLLLLPLYLGIEGVWWAMPISDIVAGLVSLALLFYQIPRLKLSE